MVKTSEDRDQHRQDYAEKTTPCSVAGEVDAAFLEGNLGLHIEPSVYVDAD